MDQLVLILPITLCAICGLELSESARVPIGPNRSVIISTTYGKIEGKTFKSKQEPKFDYHGFKGIPYAKPPLNELRFQPPVKPEPWADTKLCHNYGNSCLQISKINGSVLGNEDCLTLNVFTRNLNTLTLKPVMFWIHPGAHIRGTAADYGPDYLVERPVILVTVNFRLNIFGFLSVNDENAYGNVGIKDQVAALEWVRDNIRNFGGDPGRVTIFGESSGADCVSLLQLSDRAKGLFHQIITQSGTALNSRYLQRNPRTYAHNIGKYFRILATSTKHLVQSLQKIEAQTLTKAANSSDATGRKTDLEAGAFFPIIETENGNAILTQSPFELFQSGKFNKVPFISGYNTNEGTLGLNIVNSEMNIEAFDQNNELFVSQSFNSLQYTESIGELVKKHYLGDSSAKNLDAFSKFLGQELIVRGARKTIDYQRQNSQGYFYRFSYKGTHTTSYQGVGHGEELQYIFAMEGKTENLTTQDVQIRKEMVEMWTNFAIFGVPITTQSLLLANVTWNQVDENSVPFLDIGKRLILGANPDQEDYEFWSKLFKAFGKEPRQTY